MNLVIYKKKAPKKFWRIDRDQLSIGRGSRADITVNDPRVSRIHAYIIQDENNTIFIDANSTNGSFVNGSKTKRHILQPGDIIQIGDTELHVVKSEQVPEFGWDNSLLVIQSEFPLDYLNKQLDAITHEIDVSAQTHDKDTSLKTITSLNLSKVMNRIKTLYQSFERISSARNCMEIYEHIVESVFELLPTAENACVILRESKGEQYEPVVMRNREGGQLQKTKISKTALTNVVDKKHTLLAADVPHDPLFKKTESSKDLNIQSTLCAPMVLNDEVIGAIYVDTRETKRSFDQIDAEFLTALANHSAIALENGRLYDNLQKAYHQSILSLQNVLEARDPSTLGHAYRTAQLAVGIGKEMGLTEIQCERLRTAAELHDIGKVAFDTSLINKPGVLSDSEYASIQEHVILSQKILAPIEYLKDVLPIIIQHHERYDGTGYPGKLANDDIMLEARILSAADVFDALISHRSYKEALSVGDAVKQCWKEAGKQFDPKVLKALERYLEHNRMLIENLIANPHETL